jgi:hypothetical protein
MDPKPLQIISLFDGIGTSYIAAKMWPECIAIHDFDVVNAAHGLVTKEKNGDLIFCVANGSARYRRAEASHYLGTGIEYGQLWTRIEYTYHDPPPAVEPNKSDQPQ